MVLTSKLRWQNGAVNNMKGLDEILIEYFGAKPPVFNKKGQLTTSGKGAYDKLEMLLNDLNGIGVSIDPDKAMAYIDEIIHLGF